MAASGRFPPGRAGRLRLRSRLVTATRGSEQLSRKLRVLIAERERLHLQRLENGRDWQRSYAAAAAWQLRAEVLGGQEALTSCARRSPAEIELTWTSTVGVSHPGGVRLVSPAGPAPAPAPNAAVHFAERAFQEAMLAAVVVAAADEAMRRIDAEIALTRRRVRALDKHWIPMLRADLRRVEQSLEQVEQEDGARLRRALDRSANNRSTNRRPAP